MDITIDCESVLSEVSGGKRYVSADLRNADAWDIDIGELIKEVGIGPVLDEIDSDEAVAHYGLTLAEE